MKTMAEDQLLSARCLPSSGLQEGAGVVQALRDEAPVPPPTPPAAAFLDASASFTSPARQLQRELELALAGLPTEARWSRRRSLTFIVLTSGGLWLALISAFRSL